MTAHLLLISLGPVQEFIAQARRTRDHWYGSHLMSELARAASRALVDGGARLIFPALDSGDDELEACQKPLRPNGRPPMSIANKVLAEVPDQIDPSDLARKTRESVREFWRSDIAGRVRRECAGLLPDGIDAVWQEQIDTCLEFLATWAPLQDYMSTRKSVEQALAARKNLRDFQPWLQLRGHVRKSSLDGARETVLDHTTRSDRKLRSRYRIAKNEELDAVGLVKRAGGEPEQFVPIVNVSLAKWIELAKHEASEELNKLEHGCRQASVSPVRRDLPCTAHFKFDAEVLLPNRWKSVFEHQEPDGDTRTWGMHYVQPLLDRMQAPYPYVACLVADGDRVGAAIEAATSADAHRTLSRALANFAIRARQIVEQDHCGTLIYAGGDDVLAFLPLSTSLTCAEALRQAFASELAKNTSQFSIATLPTLSVGVGVRHIMEGMGDLLAIGREAERFAKLGQGKRPGRNALAIIVDKRSGAKRSWWASWDDWNGDPVARLQLDTSILGQQLSTRKVYEIASLLRRMPNPHHANGPGLARAVTCEIRRSLSRAGMAKDLIETASLGLTLDDRLDYPDLHSAVASWIDRMLVARTFAEAMPQLRGKEEKTI